MGKTLPPKQFESVVIMAGGRNFSQGDMAPCRVINPIFMSSYSSTGRLKNNYLQ